MLSKFKHNIQKIPDYQQKKFLLTISGGVDSVVLSDVFKKLNLDFELAHCNFKLRGEESDTDQVFVEKWAKQLNIPLHINVCDLSQNNNENTQIAARNARYEWFFDLQKKHKFDYIVTGHHLDDSLETFFINLMRATGLKGLLGINDSQNIIRPLNTFTRKEILEYAKKENLKWREDSSNASDKYQRNFIRHHIIPKFLEVQPQFYGNFQKTLQHLQQSQQVVNSWFEEKKQQLIHKQDQSERLSIPKLNQLTAAELFLFHWLSPFGFKDWKAVNQLLQAQSGKEIYSPSHRLTKYGAELILEKKKSATKEKSYIIEKSCQEILKPFLLKIKQLDRKSLKDTDFRNASKNEVFMDLDKLSFPLSIRKWQAGDYFYPFGMKGKKKLSDYFKDEKMTPSEKEKIWLICDAKKNIVWIAGKRLDNRYSITEKTKNILHLKRIT